MEIHIKTIPHNEQRYKTVGDYWKENNITEIRVSDMGNEGYEFLVAIHELAEQFLCEKRGIREEDITKFDIDFEDKRKEGNIEEPGDDEYSPYRIEHCFATGIERLMCAGLGLSWKDYELKEQRL